MVNKQHAQFSDENGNIFYLENETEDVLDPSGKPLSNGGDLSEASVTFTPDATRKLPQSGGRFKAFLGSIVKFLSDLTEVAFSGNYSDLEGKPTIPPLANNCTTTAAGYGLDARQGKVLMDKANQLSSETDKLNTRCQRYVNYNDRGLASAIDFTFDSVVAELGDGFFSRVIETNEGYFALYGYLSVNMTGIATQIGADNTYMFYKNAGGADAVLKKLGSDIKVVTQSVNYPFAGVNGEQTVDFTVDFGAVSGYTLAYAGITALDTFMSNGTIKYVQFSNLRISGSTATWSVHTARGTGYGNNGCTVQGIFIPA